MRAISLTQPWAWIILNLGKRVENRTRNIGNYRGPLLLHAAKRMTNEDYGRAVSFVAQRIGLEAARSIPVFESPALVRSAIVGRCNVVNQCAPGPAWQVHPSDPHGVHCDGAHEPAAWAGDLDRWYMGLHAWVLEDVTLTPIIPCNGARGFWHPSASVLVRLGPEGTAPHD